MHHVLALTEKCVAQEAVKKSDLKLFIFLKGHILIAGVKILKDLHLRVGLAPCLGLSIISQTFGRILN